MAVSNDINVRTAAVVLMAVYVVTNPGALQLCGRQIDVGGTCNQVWCKREDHPPGSRRHTLCSQDHRVQGCHHTDVYYLLGQRLWTDCYKGCHARECVMAQICPS